MHYTGKCPHCGVVVREGHGNPTKKIASPIQTCDRCHHTYLDDNMYEWAIIEPFYKFHFYFFANGRGFFYFILLIVSIGGYWDIALFSSFAWAVICYLWIKICKKEDMNKSHIRCLQPGYVDALQDRYTKVNYKKCNQYKEEAARNTFVRESIHRCKRCGHILNALQIVCDQCGAKRN